MGLQPERDPAPGTPHPPQSFPDVRSQKGALAVQRNIYFRLSWRLFGSGRPTADGA